MDVEKDGARHLAAENAALQAELRLLRDAMENVRHGLCVFDQQGRIAYCNRRYSEAIGLPAEKIGPGLEVRELIRLAFDAGHYAPGRSIEDI